MSSLTHVIFLNSGGTILSRKKPNGSAYISNQIPKKTRVKIRRIENTEYHKIIPQSTGDTGKWWTPDNFLLAAEAIYWCQFADVLIQSGSDAFRGLLGELAVNSYTLQNSMGLNQSRRRPADSPEGPTHIQAMMTYIAAMNYAGVGVARTNPPDNANHQEDWFKKAHIISGLPGHHGVRGDLHSITPGSNIPNTIATVDVSKMRFFLAQKRRATRNNLERAIRMGKIDPSLPQLCWPKGQYPLLRIYGTTIGKSPTKFPKKYDNDIVAFLEDVQPYEYVDGTSPVSTGIIPLVALATNFHRRGKKNRWQDIIEDIFANVDAKPFMDFFEEREGVPYFRTENHEIDSLKPLTQTPTSFRNKVKNNEAIVLIMNGCGGYPVQVNEWMNALQDANKKGIMIVGVGDTLGYHTSYEYQSGHVQKELAHIHKSGAGDEVSVYSRIRTYLDIEKSDFFKELIQSANSAYTQEAIKKRVRRGFMTGQSPFYVPKGGNERQRRSHLRGGNITEFIGQSCAVEFYGYMHPQSIVTTLFIEAAAALTFSRAYKDILQRMNIVLKKHKVPDPQTTYSRFAFDKPDKYDIPVSK